MKEIEDLKVSQGISSTITGVRDGDLAALLARVEQAEGPDRELDGALHRVLFPGERALIDPGDMRSRRPGAYGTIADLGYLGDRDLAEYLGVTAYTASLDAALALCARVLPGWRWDVSTFVTTFGDAPPVPQAFVVAPNHPPGREITSFGKSKSPALALIAATLKALIAGEAS